MNTKICLRLSIFKQSLFSDADIYQTKYFLHTLTNRLTFRLNNVEKPMKTRMGTEDQINQNHKKQALHFLYNSQYARYEKTKLRQLQGGLHFVEWFRKNTF